MFIAGFLLSGLSLGRRLKVEELTKEGLQVTKPAPGGQQRL